LEPTPYKILFCLPHTVWRTNLFSINYHYMLLNKQCKQEWIFVSLLQRISLVITTVIPPVNTGISVAQKILLLMHLHTTRQENFIKYVPEKKVQHMVQKIWLTAGECS
jgi:hypothetical protein